MKNRTFYLVCCFLVSLQAYAQIDKEQLAQDVSKAESANLELLKQFGVDYVQGYYLAKPLKNIDRESYDQAMGRLHSNVVRI